MEKIWNSLIVSLVAIGIIIGGSLVTGVCLLFKFVFPHVHIFWK